MQQEGSAMRSRMTRRSSTALRGGGTRGGGARQLSGGGDFGALDRLGKHTESRLTLPVVHLVVMQMPTYAIRSGR